ncbi:Clavaminate synthase-like protein [Aspergillus homomorphus CBS 101889]|uniref:Clavaminate synthase-like protein n=1 Tax=Aspergillus homomorphus (strain CBS 101889) TaxID=1450537 RepID=A0A395HYG9_ASPHC|nr:Clavaminate synthase-like protein [Aspergillus homomorphus CBS 101889]RAL12433.1 Clavaminate synthase-like protein [Aspergillus homomorphus CBS 101889]
MKSPHPPTAHPHRGFSPVGLENISAVSNYGRGAAHMPLLKDMKESFDIGSEADPRYQNIWPPAGVADTFQPTFTSFFQSCYRAELAILEAISIGVGLSAQTLGQMHAFQTNELRLTHYPEVARGEFAHATRIAAHTDFGTITLLFQDRVGGLQMEVPPGSGCFVDVPSGGRSECIVNVGDCLNKWTGLHSARHRVHLSEQMTEDRVPERFSIAYFAKPDRDVLLRPLLSECSNTGDKYMTADEFQHMRIAGTY